MYIHGIAFSKEVLTRVGAGGDRSEKRRKQKLGDRIGADGASKAERTKLFMD